MKKFRKGFTLVELLIVIGVIGMLGAMGMMGGQEANNIATATKIVEDFNIISAAMNMYYADNKSFCDTGEIPDESEGAEEGATTDLDAATVLAGIKPYMKSTSSIVSDTAAEGKYLITIHSDKTWWLTYKLPAGNLEKVGGILKNKAAQQGLNKTVGATTNDYDGTANVCMKVH